MNKNIAKALIALPILLGLVLPPAALAHDRHDRHDRFPHIRWHDYGHWRHGHWHHDWHDGQLGWWWVVGSTWYLYPTPLQPYTDDYVPPVVVQNPSPVVVVPQQPAAAAPPSAPAPTEQYWYYCKPSKTYYPYVRTCPSGWTRVPVTPPGAPQ